MRRCNIAWNPENSTFVSRLYDADGGFSEDEWIKKDGQARLIHKRRVTSDEEKMPATRDIEIDVYLTTPR